MFCLKPIWAICSYFGCCQTLCFVHKKMKSIKILTHIELLKKKTNEEANCELMQNEVGAASVGRDWSRIQPWPPREI